MTNKQTIVVAIDGDENSEEAVRAGLWLANSLNAPLELVHALGLPRADELDAHSALRMTVERDSVLQRRRDNLEARLQPMCTPYGRSVGQLLHIVEGPITQEILNRAEESEARLLVIGPHRRQSTLDWGSHARGILAASPCNLWVQSRPWRPVKHILVPVDLSEHSMAALRIAMDLALELGARVTCLHAWFPPEVYAGLVGDFPASDLGVSFDLSRKVAEEEFEQAMVGQGRPGLDLETRFIEGRAVQSILEHQDTVDLIALGSHGRTGLAAAVLGNTAYSVMTRATCPVLAIRHPERAFLR